MTDFTSHSILSIPYDHSLIRRSVPAGAEKDRMMEEPRELAELIEPIETVQKGLAAMETNAGTSKRGPDRALTLGRIAPQAGQPGGGFPGVLSHDPVLRSHLGKPWHNAWIGRELELASARKVSPSRTAVVSEADLALPASWSARAGPASPALRNSWLASCSSAAIPCWLSNRNLGPAATGSRPRSTGSPMTAVSAEAENAAEAKPGTEAGRRRSRYERDSRAAVLTLYSLRLVEYVIAYCLVSLPQFVRLYGPSPKATQRAMRTLFDAGLVDIVAVPRAALAEPNDPNDASLPFGSAPNIYLPTRAAIRLLDAHGLAEALDPLPAYGPKNALLRHELGVRDVRIWLELAARRHSDQTVKPWHDGPEAVVDLERTQVPKTVRPDAWFVYGLGQREGHKRVLVGFLELDRATERGDRRWTEKLAAYQVLFSRNWLREVTAYVKGRILVVCPNEARRNNLAELIADKAEPPVKELFWLAEGRVLGQSDLSLGIWHRPGSQGPHSHLPAAILKSGS